METNFKGTNLKAKLTHSKGSIKYEVFDGLIDVWSDIDDPMGRKVALKEAKLNGQLIADAFNVRQQINVDLPELLNQRDELLKAVKEAKRVICSMKLSMWAHPDCSKDSEFYDMATTGEETEDKLQDLITKIEQK